MNTVYIEPYPFSDGQYEAWIVSEDGKQQLKYPSIAACRKRWEPRGFKVIVIKY